MKLDDRLKKVMIIVVGVFVLFIVILALVSACTRGPVYTINNIDGLKSRLVNLARDHYRHNEDALPEPGSSITLQVQTLVDAGSMRPLYQMLQGSENCNGHITITNNNGYFLYVPYINCGAFFQTQMLTTAILEHNPIVDTGVGLYAMSLYQQDAFVFRGENLNNHIYFAGRMWLIIRVNADGTIKVLDVNQRLEHATWDNRVNPDRRMAEGINDFIQANNVDSRLRERLLNAWVDNSLLTDNDKAHIIPQNLCIGKRYRDATVNDGSIECAEQLPNQLLGSLAVYEYLLASLDPYCDNALSHFCTNSNYLSLINTAFWSITADAYNSWQAYIIDRNLLVSNASRMSNIKVTALLSSELTYAGGDGSIDNPFRISSSPNN